MAGRLEPKMGSREKGNPMPRYRVTQYRGSRLNVYPVTPA